MGFAKNNRTKNIYNFFRKNVIDKENASPLTSGNNSRGE